MNGLKYIRTRCNLSLSELADMIGVSRQALSSWENGRKDIPEQRVEQLAEFFGVNREFLGEISDEMKNELIDKAMFRYDENGKEYYRLRPQEGVTSLDQTRVSFFFDNSQKSEEEEMPTDKSSEVNSNLQDDDKFMADVHTFPDFSDIEDRDKKEESKNSRIEEDVMDAASKYIESIMSNNK